MERATRQMEKRARPSAAAEKTSASRSAEADVETDIDRSPLITAQRKALQGMFGSAVQTGLGPGLHGVVQRLKIGKTDVKTATALAPYLGMTTDDEVIAAFNAKLGDFPKVTKSTFNGFLNGRSSRLRGGNISDPDDFLARLANSYKGSYIGRTNSGFAGAMDGIKDDKDYKALMASGYAEAGTDDGKSVKDTYDKGLACTLFALLKLKPGFLGAADEKQLHYILRANPKTRKYDNDRQVAQIRLSAGLKYEEPAEEKNTVQKFVGRLTEGDRARKYIIDPAGEAHTFTLAYDGGWKKYDNDNTDGASLKSDDLNLGIRVFWKA